MSQDGDDGLHEQHFAAADEDQAHKCGAAHRALWVVEETEDARVVELERIVLNEEVACMSGSISWLWSSSRWRPHAP